MTKKTFTVITLLGSFFLLATCAAATSPLALLAAFPDEIAWLDSQVVQRQDQFVLGHKFTTGQLAGQEIVLTLTGVGKVNAALTTALLLDHFQPIGVIFSGVAGNLNPDLQPGDVIIASRTAQHDLGEMKSSGLENFGVRNPNTGVRNPVFFPADSLLLQAVEKAVRQVTLERALTDTLSPPPRVITGTIITGDQFVTSSPAKLELHNRLQADAVEMEGAAVAQVCYQAGVPCLILRALSDRADEQAKEDFERYYRIAARNANRVVLKMLDLLCP